MPPATEVMIDQYLEGDDLPTKFWSEHDKQTLKAIFKVMACALISLLVVGSVAFSWYHTQTDTVVLISTSAANAEHPNLVITDHGTFQLTGLNLLLHDGKFEYS